VVGQDRWDGKQTDIFIPAPAGGIVQTPIEPRSPTVLSGDGLNRVDYLRGYQMMSCFRNVPERVETYSRFGSVPTDAGE
jgi:hypothetical protein